MAAVEEDIESLPLPSGADDSRNALSETGLLMMANQARLRKDLQPLSLSDRETATTVAAATQFGGGGGDETEYVADPLVRSGLPVAQRGTIYYHEEDGNKEEGSDMDLQHSLYSDDDHQSLRKSARSRAGTSRKSNILSKQFLDDDEDDENGDDDLIVPENGIFGDQCPPGPMDAALSINDRSVLAPSVDKFAGNASRIDASLGPAGYPVDYSQTRKAMASAASLGSFGELNRRAESPVMAQPTPSASNSGSRRHSASESGVLSDSNRRRTAENSSQSSAKSRSTGPKSLHRHKHESGDRSSSSRSRRSSRSSIISGSDAVRESDVSGGHSRRHKRRESTKTRKSSRKTEKKREQTYEEFQDAIRRKVKQQEDMEKREMLLLFYQKQRYENAEVPKKFFEQGLNSDLYEMRWWYYKLIRDTRINDEVASMKHKIVQGSRFALFINNTIGNPLNLRLDNNFPKELANTLNTSTDRHLREHIKSKCGVSGPKPRPWSHILRDIWECGWNYHQNKLAVEEAEKRRETQNGASTRQAPVQKQQQPQTQAQAQAQQHFASAAPPFDAYHAMLNEQQRARQFASTQPTVLSNNNGSYDFDWQDNYQRLLQHQALQRQMFEQQRPQAPPPAFQPDRAPLRNVFRNMSAEMRRESIPEHLRPPSAPTRNASSFAQQTSAPTAVTPNMSLGEAAYALRQQVAQRPQPQAQQPHAQTQSATQAPLQAQLQRPQQPQPQRLSQPLPMSRPQQARLQTLSLPPQKKRLTKQAPLPTAPATSVASPRALHAPRPPPPARPFAAAKPSLLSNLAQPAIGRRPLPINEREQNTAATLHRPLESFPNVRTITAEQILTRPLNATAETRPNVSLYDLVQQQPVASNASTQEQQALHLQQQQGLHTQGSHAQQQGVLREREKAISLSNLQPNALAAVMATSVAEGQQAPPKKRSMEELMQELQRAHDEEVESTDSEVDDDYVPEMPPMASDDKFASALAMMEQFQGGEEQDQESKSRAALYDIEDVLDLNATTSLSDIQPQERKGRERSRRRRTRKDREQAAAESPDGDGERAVTPPPQSAVLAATTGEAKSSVGRSGKTKFQF